MVNRLRALLELGLDDPEPALPAFADLLGMEVPGSGAYQALSAAEKRSRMHDAMIEQLVGLSRKRPTLVVLEDAHWADPSTLEFLDLLLGAVANERVLVLITSRPEDLPELARPNMTQLALTRLGKAEVVNLIEAVMATDIALPEIVNEIASRTDGIPLFIEEVTKAVMEGRSEGADRKAAPIPASLHDSLMARLDRLEGVREVAQVAASIGREFDRELLLDASGLDPRQVDDALDRLVEAELIFRRRGAQGAAFIFKHALVRDAAYSSLLGSRRRAIHAAILSALETRAGVAPALIGQHAQEAGDAVRAIEAFTRAGGEAARQSANEEAVRAYERALALTAELPETEAESIRTRLQVAICVPLIAVCGYAAPEVEQLHQETLRRLEADGSESDRFKVMRGLWNCIFDKGDLVRSGRLADTLVELAESSGRGDWLRLAYRAHGSNLFNEGRFAEARSAVEASINASDAWSRETTLFEHGEDPDTISRQYLAVIRTIEGSLDMGLKLIDQALASARRLSLPISEVFARTHRDYVFYLLREPEACRENAETSLAISEDRQYPFWAASSRLFIGWAAALTTRDPAAMDEVKAGIAAWYTTGARLHMTTWNCVAADAALHLGRFSDAEAFLRDAFAFVDETGERFMLAELLRLRAWVLSANDRSDLAEVALRESLAVASQQGARLFGLRTAADLVRLQDRAGQGADGRERLTGMLRSFTEGFDRRDLQQAQALLAAS
jgi:tetratricopeptide (TPR) repeat protein